MFQGEPLKLEIGDAEAKLAAAPHRIDVTYTTPHQNHNPIELHACTLAWKGEGDDVELTIHDATQAVVHTAWSMAHVFGLNEEQVHVTSPFVGGGFGSKTLWNHQVLAAAASKLVGRPVRLMLSREGVYRVVGGRTRTEQRVALGARDDGHLTALIHMGTVPMSAHNNMPEPFMLPALHAYAADSFRLDVETCTMDILQNTFMRAPGESVGTFGLECGIDELAVALGMDPIELRLANEPDQDPTSGLPWSSRNSLKAWRDGAERFGWRERSATTGARRDGEWLVGMGCAQATYPYYRMPGGAARIVLSTDAGAKGGARVRVEIAAHEMGMGTSTAQTMVTADRLRRTDGMRRGLLRRLALSGARARGRIAADRVDRRGRDGGAGGVDRRTAEAGPRRLAVEGPEGRRCRRTRRRSRQARRSVDARDLRVAARAWRPRKRWSWRPRHRPRWRRRTGLCIRTARCSARSA